MSVESFCGEMTDMDVTAMISVRMVRRHAKILPDGPAMSTAYQPSEAGADLKNLMK